MFQVTVVLSATLKVLIIVLQSEGKVIFSPMAFLLQYLEWPLGNIGKLPYCQSGILIIHPSVCTSEARVLKGEYFLSPVWNLWRDVSLLACTTIWAPWTHLFTESKHIAAATAAITQDWISRCSTTSTSRAPRLWCLCHFLFCLVSSLSWSLNYCSVPMILNEGAAFEDICQCRRARENLNVHIYRHCRFQSLSSLEDTTCGAFTARLGVSWTLPLLAQSRNGWHVSSVSFSVYSRGDKMPPRRFESSAWRHSHRHHAPQLCINKP